MSKSYDSLKEEFIKNKDDKDYRHSYADENLNLTVGTQLKVLREQRNWRQEDLAKLTGMKQSMVSRYEDVNYSSWSINTLRRFALAFDVILDVRFRSFGELVKSTEEFSRESLQVPPFSEDPFFEERKEKSKQLLNLAMGSGKALAAASSVVEHLPEVLKTQRSVDHFLPGGIIRFGGAAMKEAIRPRRNRLPSLTEDAA